MADDHPSAPAPAASPERRVPATPLPRSNRGFWLIAAALGAAGIVVVVSAFLTRPQPPGSSARRNLELAIRAATIVQREGGSFAAASADEVGVVELTLTFIPGDRASDGPTVVSVHPEANSWVAAALASDGSCRSVRVEAGPANELSIDRDIATDAPCSADALARAGSAGDVPDRTVATGDR